MTDKTRDADIVAALEGRKAPKLSDFDFSLDTPTAAEKANQSGGYDFSLEDKPDSFKVAADARIVAVLDESAARRTDPLWMERAEVNLASEAYRDARLKSLARTETYESAAREARQERDRYMAAHRAEHATEAALLEATATHLTGLAAAYSRPSGRTATTGTSTREATATPKTTTRTTRIRDHRGGGLTRH